MLVVYFPLNNNVMWGTLQFNKLESYVIKAFNNHHMYTKTLCNQINRNDVEHKFMVCTCGDFKDQYVEQPTRNQAIFSTIIQ